MDKLFTRLEKLKDFEKRDAEIKARAAALEIDARKLGEEFREYMTAELGLPSETQLHLSAILSRVMESSVEPRPQIIT